MNRAQETANFLSFPRQEVKVWAWLLLLALFFNSTVPNILNSTSSLNSEKVLLCTSSGYEWVSSLSLNANEESKVHCVYCFNTDDFSSIFSGVVAHLQRINSTVLAVLIRDQHLSSPRFLLPPDRAPPLLFS